MLRSFATSKKSPEQQKGKSFTFSDKTNHYRKRIASPKSPLSPKKIILDVLDDNSKNQKTFTSITDGNSTNYKTKTTSNNKSKSSKFNSSLKLKPKTPSEIPSNINDFENYFARLKTEIIGPIKEEIAKRRLNSNDLSREINNYFSNVSNVNNELSSTQKINHSLIISANKFSLEAQRIRAENDFMNQEIEKIKKENSDILAEVNRLDKEKIIFENEYDNCKNAIDTMKKQIKDISNLSSVMMEQKKIMKSALLLVQKKSDELKHKLYFSQQKGTDVSRLSNLFESFRLDKA